MLDELTDSFNRIAADLCIPKAFVDRMLTKDDDWSFVIRVHFLLEGALTHLLTRVTREELGDTFATMSMEHRLRSAKSLDVLPKSYRGVIRYLSSLRNQLVHDFGHAQFTFSDYLGDPNRRKRFAETLGGLWEEDRYELKGEVLSHRESAAAHPRAAIWGFVISCLALADVSIELTAAARGNEALRLLTQTMEE